jgi:hypothetical protein
MVARAGIALDDNRSEKRKALLYMALLTTNNGGGLQLSTLEQNPRWILKAFKGFEAIKCLIRLPRGI